MPKNQSQVEFSKSAETVLKGALETIIASHGGGCQSFTGGIGSCFRFGRTPIAQDGADRVCDSCIADAALNQASATACQ